MITLTWNPSTNGYEAEVEQGLLHVDGDTFAEDRHDANWAQAKIRHPEMSDEEIEEFLHTPEGDKIDTENWDELIVAEGWLASADMVNYDPEGYFSDVFVVKRESKA